MRDTFFIRLFATLFICTILSVPTSARKTGHKNVYKADLIVDLKDLFSHQRHKKSFEKLNVSCLDCHFFSLKPLEKGPLAPEIKRKVLKKQATTCHNCHLEKIKLPRQNQCEVCHKNTKRLKPRDHFVLWKQRHGNAAQIDQDSCRNCHARNECTDCHVQRDTMNTRVHSGNFRFTHSIKARFKPNSCVVCHQSPGFCIKCHSGGL